MRPWLCMGMIWLAACTKHEPPPWITSVRITGPEPTEGILGLSEDPDLPPMGPNLGEGFASRRTLWHVREEVQHPWSRWWNFIPVATNLLGYIRVTVDEDLLEADAQRIGHYFADRGWREVQVDWTLKEPSFWVSRLRGAHKRDFARQVHFQVDPGRQYTVDTLRFYGLFGYNGLAGRTSLDGADLSTAQRRRLQPPSVGDAWGVRDEEALLERVQYAAEIGGHGLATTHVHTRVDEQGGCDLQVCALPGPVVDFGAVRFEGNERLSGQALARSVSGTVVAGETWDPADVAKLRAHLLRLPAIDDVAITKGKLDQGRVPVVVQVTERPPADFAPEFEIIGRSGTFTVIGGGLLTRRYVGRGHSELKLLAKGGYRHIYREGWHGDSGPAATLGAGLEAALTPAETVGLHHWAQVEADQWHGYHYVDGLAEFGPRFARGPVQLWAGYQARQFTTYPYRLQQEVYNTFFETDDEGNRPLERAYFAHQAIVKLAVDSRDDPVDTRRGMLLDASWIPHGISEGSRLRRFEADWDAFWPTPMELMTMRTRLGGGVLDVDGDLGIPLGHRLYTGGAYFVRGWADRGILPPGTRWRPGEPRVGGDAMVMATLEPRFHVHPHVILTPFVDLGSTWNQVSDVSGSTLRWSGGGGARFPLVIGEAHLLFAWIDDPMQDSLEPPMRIHMTLEGGM